LASINKEYQTSIVSSEGDTQVEKLVSGIPLGGFLGLDCSRHKSIRSAMKGNKMVHMQVSYSQLADRGRMIISIIPSLSIETVTELLEK
tara:strand:+ start:1460 stop:1726 length:267 start_codon:yes stop_codon:yes gene_type:complete